MLGLDGVEDGHARPMTAQVDGARGPIWFFTASHNGLVEMFEPGDRAIATFAARGHDFRDPARQRGDRHRPRGD